MCVEVCAQAVWSVIKEPARRYSFLIKRIYTKLGAFGKNQKPVV
jgi:hypothetical protein